MLKYINSWILKAEAGDNASHSMNVDQTDTHQQSRQRTNSDPWTAMVFPSYLDYETLEEKLTKADKIIEMKSNKPKHDHATVGTSGRIGWNVFVPSNWPVVATQMNKNGAATNTVQTSNSKHTE
eukprot:368933_1